MAVHKPRIRQYQANGLKFPFSKMEKAERITNNPTTQEVVNPIMQAIGEKSLGRSCCKSSIQLPPIIVGIESKKEKKNPRLEITTILRIAEYFDVFSRKDGAKQPKN